MLAVVLGMVGIGFTVAEGGVVGFAAGALELAGVVGLLGVVVALVSPDESVVAALSASSVGSFFSPQAARVRKATHEIALERTSVVRDGRTVNSDFKQDMHTLYAKHAERHSIAVARHGFVTGRRT